MKRKSDQPQHGKRWKRARPTKPINISLILANIEDMNAASLIELQYALTTMNNHNGFSPSIILLTETWECKLSRAEPTLKGYTYRGKPIDKLPQATRGHGGTGMWIKNAIANQCSVATPTKENPNILWIQMMDESATTYIAVVYSRPNKPKEHTDIMTTLRHNCLEFQCTGRVVICGDMNAHLTRITHRVEPKRPYGPYENQLTQLMNTTGLRALIASDDSIVKGEHWTYKGRSAGEEVVDYILVEPGAKESATYAVHQEYNLQGTHRLITATLPYTHQEGGIHWGQHKNPKYEWDVEGIKRYQEKL